MINKKQKIKPVNVTKEYYIYVTENIRKINMLVKYSLFMNFVFTVMLLAAIILTYKGLQ